MQLSIKHQIPIRTFAEWDDARPGFLEMDLVGHDGGSAQGDYCFTLDMTDVASGWSELAAVINKAEIHVFEGIEALRQRLPFAVAGLHSDNGSEFINHHLLRYCQDEHLTFTRGRPWRKNDTCHVEQKNWSIVRRFAGYARFNTQAQCQLLNQLYVLLHEYINYFMPSMRRKEKIRNGAKATQRYYEPQTPYAMLLESPHIDPATKARLKRHYQTLNPAELKRRIDAIENKLAGLVVRKRRPLPKPEARGK